MLINFSRLNNFSISFRCYFALICRRPPRNWVSYTLKQKICIFIIRKKKYFIFLSLETKRSLEWKMKKSSWKRKKRKLVTQKQTHTRTWSNWGGWYEVNVWQWWQALGSTPPNAVRNGTLNECFKNTIKQRRGCTEKIVYFLSNKRTNERTKKKLWNLQFVDIFVRCFCCWRWCRCHCERRQNFPWFIPSTGYVF